jgi:Big-like domain-containing protein
MGRAASQSPQSALFVDVRRKLPALRPCEGRVLRLTVCLALGLGYFASAQAQPAGRRATNIAAILAYPNFYHMRPILLVGTVAQLPNGEFRVSDNSGSLRLIPQGNAPDGLDEVRGQFWDIGRMKPDDPRLAGYDLRATFHVDPEGAWPRPGEVTAVIASGASAITPATLPTGLASVPGSTKTPGFAPVSVRSIVLDAPRYADQKVMITGQFYGRNLNGDLPDAPRQSRYDFVLRSADASIWVTNLRPKGKDAKGKNFEFGLDARLDTGKWLQISGTVRKGRGLLWIDGEAGTLAPAQAPTDTVVEEEPPIRVPAAPASEVVFSAPTADETDVPTATNVRIQFSRDLDPATLRGRIRVGYLAAGGDPGNPIAQTVDFTANYSAFNRVVELKFAKPLQQFRTLKVELLDGILGTDQQGLKPWTLTFEVGGS